MRPSPFLKIYRQLTAAKAGEAFSSVIFFTTGEMPGPWQIVPHPKIILVKVIGSEREREEGMDRQTDMEGGDQDTSWEEKHQKLEGDKRWQ